MKKLRRSLRVGLFAVIVGSAVGSPAAAVSLDPTLYNFGWSVQGSAPIAPSLVFDNGRKVYLKFINDVEVPTIFAETPQGLLLLNWASEDGYIVVPNLKGALRFQTNGIEAQASKQGYFKSSTPLKIVGVAAAPDTSLGQVGTDLSGTSAHAKLGPANPVSRDRPAGLEIEIPVAPQPNFEAKAPLELSALFQPTAVTARSYNFVAPETDVTGAAGRPGEGEHITLSPRFDLRRNDVTTLDIATPNVTPAIDAASEVQGLPATDRPVPASPSIWQVTLGGSLQQLVRQWGEQAGWQIQWETDLDYPMEAPFSVQGDFLEALSQLFAAYAGAPRTFRVEAAPNNVISVSEKR